MITSPSPISPSPVLSRLRSSAAAFVRDDSGGATLWSLTWLLGFAVMAGLAIDSTNGWRNKTMLQSTADVAALAGAMSLPDLELEKGYAPGSYGNVIASAMDYADWNLPMASADGSHSYGNYLDPNWANTENGDIRIGHWDTASRTFTQGGEPVNAVQVDHFQNEEERGNGVGTAVLHAIGLDNWEVASTATAMRGIDSCLFNGIISREDLHVNGSGAEIRGKVCLHSQLRVNVSGGATWESPEALSLGAHKPDVTSGDWRVQGPQSDFAENDITAQMQDPNDERDLYPPMVDQIVEIGQSMLAGIVGYRHFSYPQTLELEESTPKPEVIVLPDGFAEVAGSAPPLLDGQTWRRTEDSVQVASLDGFAHLAALLGLSAQATTADLDYHRTYRYGDIQQKGNSTNFDWPANTGEVTLDGVDWTEEGAPLTDPGILTEERIYFADNCQSGTLELTGAIRNLTIVTNCRLHIAGTARIQNAVLLTSWSNPTSGAVRIENGAQIGSSCDKWGNVRIYSNGDINVVSGNTTDSKFYGAQLVARTDIHFSAQTDMSKGISILSGGQTHITAGAKIGGIDSSSATQAGCPVTGGVDFEFDKYVQRASLVE